MGRTVRWPLLLPGLALLLAYGAETALAVGRPYFAWDVSLERALQALTWPPLLGPMSLLDRFEGLWQVGAGLLAALLVFVFNRRAAVLVVAGWLSSAVYYLTQLLVERPRPAEHLVHVLRHTTQASYPSGHAVFFTWLAILLPLSLRPVWRWWWLLAAGLGAVLLVAVVGRLDLGEHWPSDVLAGLLLGLGWTLCALGLRPLSRAALG